MTFDSHCRESERHIDHEEFGPFVYVSYLTLTSSQLAYLYHIHRSKYDADLFIRIVTSLYKSYSLIIRNFELYSSSTRCYTSMSHIWWLYLICNDGL